MSVAVFGSTGALGGLVVESLLARGVEPRNVLALGRNESRLRELEQERGVRTAVADLDAPEGLSGTLEGVEKVVLVSTSVPGRRVPQHRAAIEASREAGVRLFAYTSLLDAETSTHVLAPEHQETERLVRESGLDWVLLRNGWYTENQKPEFDAAAATGAVTNSVGPDARLATAPRKDYAEAVAAVLTGEGHENTAYELSGDTAWTYPEFAATAARVLGREVVYQEVSPEDEKAGMQAAGMDHGLVEMLSESNRGTREGLISRTTGQLSALIGHPTEPLEETMKRWAS